ncbi:MAG: hypothetical protein ACXVEF_31195 [Polyangiales bacterium]
MSVRQVLVFAAVAGAPLALAAAERPAAHLEYARKPGAELCADESGTRDAVAARLGYDPFRDDAERRIKVTITHDGKGFHATIEEGTRVRKLDSASKDCADLSSSIAVSLATAIDPLGIGAAASSAPSASTAPSASISAKPTASSPPKPSAAPAPKPTELAFVATVGGHAAFGAAPDLAFGLTTGFAVRIPTFQFGIEGRVDAEARGPGPNGGEVKSSIIGLSFVPCVYQEVLFACAVGTFGALRGAGAGVGSPRKATTFYSAAGVRLGVEIPLAGPIALRIHGDALSTITRTTLFVQDAEAWTTPTVHGIFGLDLAGIFR